MRSSNLSCHLAGEPGPVVDGGCAAGRQVGERFGDLVQVQPDALGRPDERNPAKDLAPVPSLATLGALGLDEALGFVEAQS